MSEENLNALRRIYDGWAAGNMWAEASVYDPHVVYVSQAAEPGPGPHHGLEALTNYMRGFFAQWQDWRIEASELREAGNTFMVRVRRVGIGMDSEVPVEDEAFHTWTFRGRKVVRLEIFAQEGAALETTGLSE
jgi:ketosteroid isomerase-like protein